MKKELVDKFVTSYFRILSRNPNLIHQFYDNNAIIVRANPNEKIKFPFFLKPLSTLTSYKSIDDIIKIYNYTYNIFDEKIIISIFGSLTHFETENCFSQQFILENISSHWYIISDVHFIFSYSSISISEEKNTSYILRNKPIYTENKYNFPKNLSTKAKIDTFDHERSITILNLSKYSGNNIREILSNRFGPISNQHYTHNTVYIEFVSSFSAIQASNNILNYQNSTYKIEKGVIIPSNSNFKLPFSKSYK